MAESMLFALWAAEDGEMIATNIENPQVGESFIRQVETRNGKPYMASIYQGQVEVVSVGTAPDMRIDWNKKGLDKMLYADIVLEFDEESGNTPDAVKYFGLPIDTLTNPNCDYFQYNDMPTAIIKLNFANMELTDDQVYWQEYDCDSANIPGTPISGPGFYCQQTYHDPADDEMYDIYFFVYMNNGQICCSWNKTIQIDN